MRAYLDEDVFKENPTDEDLEKVAEYLTFLKAFEEKHGFPFEDLFKEDDE